MPDQDGTDPAPGPIDRRAFVRRAGAVAGAAIVGPTLLRSGFARAQSTRESILARPATECPIDTVVVLMMENRSFDHYLGWLGADHAYLDAGRRRWGSGFTVAAKQHLQYRNRQGELITTESIVDRPDDPNPYRLCSGPQPGHGWHTGRRQRDAGFLAAGSGNNENAVGYYRAGDVPVHAALARRFTVADHHFASLLGPTFPNRRYFHSAQSEGLKTDPGPLRPGIFDDATIWERLAAGGVSSAYYYGDTPASLLVYGHQRMDPFIRNLDRYFEDCANGTLPHFVFLAPAFSGPYRTDNHPRGCINVGERFVLETFGAFVQSKQWERGLFTLFYDEWGGFFDHVRPPILPDDRASKIDANNFGQAGFRVPSIIASPHARANFVDSTVYDHTSLLRFLEWRFLGAPAEGPGRAGGRWALTRRDRGANNMGRSLTADSNPEVALNVSVRRPTAPCGNELGLSVADPQPDPFRLSEEMRTLTDRLYPAPTLTPWLD